MHILRKSTDVRVPIRLIDGSGLPVTGMGASDVQGGTAQIIKADGTSVSLSLAGPPIRFFEITPYADSRGLYHLLLPAAVVDVIGPIQWVVLPAAAGFAAAGYVGYGVVEDLPALIMNYLVNSDTAAPANTAAAALRLIKQYFAGRVELDVALNLERIFKEDRSIVTASFSTPIIVTTVYTHGLVNGDWVRIAGVVGNTNANGDWIVTKIDNYNFSLDTSIGNAPYVSGGTLEVELSRRNTYDASGAAATEPVYLIEP